MKKIDFRGKYGSAGSREVYIARIQNALSSDKKKPKQKRVNL